MASARPPPLPLPPRSKEAAAAVTAAAPSSSSSPPPPSSAPAAARTEEEEEKEEEQGGGASGARAEADELLRRLSGSNGGGDKEEREQQRKGKGRKGEETKLFFDDGRVAVAFRERGTKKLTFPDGRALTLFSNGDVRRNWPRKKERKAGKNGGEAEEKGAVFEKSESYFFAEAGAWQTTLVPSSSKSSSSEPKVEVFHFASGQVEAHVPCGARHVLLAAEGEGGGKGGRNRREQQRGRIVVVAEGSKEAKAKPVPLSQLCPWVLMEVPRGTDAERLWRGEW